MAVVTNEYGKYRELLKFEIRKLIISFGKKSACEKRSRIDQIIKDISATRTG